MEKGSNAKDAGVSNEVEIDFEQLTFLAGTVFTPAVPVGMDSIFAGRSAQITMIVDAINQQGQHAILYGERGVGKTSLANVVQRYVHSTASVISARVNCYSRDTYSALWRRMFEQITLTYDQVKLGFKNETVKQIQTVASGLLEPITLDTVRSVLTQLGRVSLVVLIFDEFDALPEGSTRRAMAETVKLCSDFAVAATLVLVGIADSVIDLLADHESVERALVQIPMPRMSDAELVQIVNKGGAKLGIEFTGSATKRIVELSKGLPHYTHLLALYAARAAFAEEQVIVGGENVSKAIDDAIANASRSTIETYNRATTSVRTKHLFKEVLLACALAETDELGWFPASAVRDPLNRIVADRQKPYDVPAFVRHLDEFTTKERGQILQRRGAPHKYQFRFKNPLMPPFVVLRGYADERIPGT